MKWTYIYNIGLLYLCDYEFTWNMRNKVATSIIIMQVKIRINLNTRKLQSLYSQFISYTYRGTWGFTFSFECSSMTSRLNWKEVIINFIRNVSFIRYLYKLNQIRDLNYSFLFKIWSTHYSFRYVWEFIF